MIALPEIYIATDVETDGPIPGPFSMLSLGMTTVGTERSEFYTEIQPISDHFDEDTLSMSGLDRERLKKEAPKAELAMSAAMKWVTDLAQESRPVFLAAPAVWDGMFIHWYFMKFVGQSPFGRTGSGIDLRSYWMGLNGCKWVETRKQYIKKELQLHDLPHTHHAGEDAAELATIFETMLRRRTNFAE